MNKKEEYRQRVEHSLTSLAARKQELEALARQATCDAGRQYEVRLEAISQRFRAARDRVTDLRTASDEAWESVRDGVEAAMGELKSGLENAISKFK